MKIKIISDLHLEFIKEEYILNDKSDFDCLVVAGDLHSNPYEGVKWLSKFKNKEIIYIAGNHEFYSDQHKPLEEVYEILRAECKKEGIHFLQNNSVIIKNVKFIGCTLWTDYMLDNDIHSKLVAYQLMNDFLYIYSTKSKNKTKLILPEDIINEFNISKEFLNKELNSDFSGKKIVVTHHLPSSKSISKKYINSVLNPAFASNLEELVRMADVWIHGHTHSNSYYRLGKCEVFCNPKGYINENLNFEEDLVIDV